MAYDAFYFVLVIESQHVIEITGYDVFCYGVPCEYKELSTVMTVSTLYYEFFYVEILAIVGIMACDCQFRFA